MTKDEELFIDTLRDLEGSCTRRDAYEVLRASGLLRQLLMDSPSLTDLVNRTYKLKLRFTVAEPAPLPLVDGILFRFKNPDVSSFPNAKTVQVPVKDFLAFECLYFKGNAWQVKDVIRVCAHVKGGVHRYPPDAEQQGLLDIDEVLTVGGQEPTLGILRGIGAVALGGLIPLRQRVLGNP